MNSKPEFLSCDLETNMQLDPRGGPIDQIGFGFAPGKCMREKYKESKRSIYQEIFDEFPQVFHNAAFDIYWLEHYGYRIPNWEDTMLGAHLLTPDLPLGLDFQNTLYVGYPPWKNTKRSNPHSYHGTDLDTTWQIWDTVKDELVLRGVWDLYQNEIKPVTRTCIDTKAKGIKIDRRQMLKTNIALTRMIERIDLALKKFFPIDWNSPQQVMDVLYDRLNLPEQRINKTGNRTSNMDALESLQHEHPLVKLLLGRRKYEKQRSTYTDYNIDEQGYFHGDISFTTSTGRARGFLLTMQHGPIRKLLIPDEPDWEFAYADWDRVELWISAVVSGDKEFQRILKEFNFHQYVGEQVFGEPIAKSDPRYQETKFITHGTNYGRSIQAIVRDHGIPHHRVKGMQQWMNREFSTWEKWRADQFIQARRDGRLSNSFGFTRYFWSGNIKGMAYAFEPQSCVAHMIKRCMTQLHAQLPKPARVVFPFHDAMLVTYPKTMRQEVHTCLKDIMEQRWPMLHNWSADCSIGIGSNFQEASEA